jgi:pyruvate,water dikinase
MVNSYCSGVMFTRSPLTGDRSVITLEGSWGLGSAIVSGEVTPDKFVVNKITREITRRDIAMKGIAHVPAPDGGILEQEVAPDLQTTPCLQDAQILALAEIAKQVEKHYGKPQDIEWALDQDGNILLLQSRPETVWASKDTTPVAKPAAKPFDHIFKVMGGGARKP